MATNKVLQSSNSRVFLIEGRAGPTHEPSYESCMRLTGVSQGFGEIERVECPDPYNYGKFVEVAQIRGAAERATATLEGRYAMDVLSELLKMARKGCAVDVQLHMGLCTNPSEFDVWDKVVVMEDAFITNYGTDDLGALQSGDNAVVNETADISATDIYEIRKLTWASEAAAVVTNEIADVTFGDTKSCGTDCEEESDGCQKIYAVTKSGGGSGTARADLVYTIDGGATWYANDIDSMDIGQDPYAVVALGSYVVVIDYAGQSFHYTEKANLDGIHSVSWTEAAITEAKPTDAYSLGNFAFVVGDGGYVWKLVSVSTGTVVLDAGSATAVNLAAVHALDPEHAVAVGASGVVIYTTNGTQWAAAYTIPANTTLNTVFMRTKTEWWVGGANGNVYYTTNSGDSWSTVTFSGSGAGNVADITFGNRSIGYISHTTAGGVGRLFRSYNGGYTWNLMPEDATTLPTTQRFNAVSACAYDPNTVIAGGLGAATDGILLMGVGS